MPKLKVLKSIGHNLAHSYLSLMNYREGNYICSLLEDIARQHNEPHIVIDVLHSQIQPTLFNIPVIQTSLLDMRKELVRLLHADKLTIDDVQSITITIDFQLENTLQLRSGLEVIPYKCVVDIEDCNGKSYQSSVREWWNY
jgi:hypothetical protein